MKQMHDHGYTITAIGILLNISQSCVSRSLKRIKEEGHSKSHKRIGRPRVTSRREDIAIKKFIKQYPTASSSEIRANLPNPVKLSSRTIRRRLFEEMGLKSYKHACKPHLSKKNIKDRLNFCMQYKKWSPQQWENVMFSDKTIVCQFANFTEHVRRPVGRALWLKIQSCCCEEPTQSYGMWSNISWWQIWSFVFTTKNDSERWNVSWNFKKQTT